MGLGMCTCLPKGPAHHDKFNLYGPTISGIDGPRVDYQARGLDLGKMIKQNSLGEREGQRMEVVKNEHVSLTELGIKKL